MDNGSTLGGEKTPRYDQFMMDEELKGLLESMRQENLALHAKAFQRMEDFEARTEKRFDGVDSRFDGVDQRFEGVDQRFDGIDQRLDGIDKRLEEVDKRFEGIDKRFDETNQRIADSEASLGHRFDVTIEHLKDRFDFLAEGLVAVDQKVDRRCDSLEARIDESAAETHALIKFTYGQLDRSRRRAK